VCRPRQGVERFLAKIGETNTASLHLFTRLGFSEVSRSAIFKARPAAVHVMLPARAPLTRLMLALLKLKRRDLGTGRDPST